MLWNASAALCLERMGSRSAGAPPSTAEVCKVWGVYEAHGMIIGNHNPLGITRPGKQQQFANWKMAQSK